MPFSRPLAAVTALVLSALLGATAVLSVLRGPSALLAWLPGATLVRDAAAALPPDPYPVVAAEPPLDDLLLDTAPEEPDPVDPGDPTAHGALVDARATSDGLAGLATGDDPPGSPAAVALRFVQALQDGDDLAAARQLAWQERLRLSRTDPWVLARVMRDVRRHAALDGRSPCRHARPYDGTSVLVACGAVRVLVKTDPTGLGGNGVCVLAGAPRDRYRHDHTYAFSSVAV